MLLQENYICDDGCEVPNRDDCRMGGRSLIEKGLPEDVLCGCDCHDTDEDLIRGCRGSEALLLELFAAGPLLEMHYETPDQIDLSSISGGSNRSFSALPYGIVLNFMSMFGLIDGDPKRNGQRSKIIYQIITPRGERVRQLLISKKNHR